MLLLKTIDGRGCNVSSLMTKTRKGYMFHCWKQWSESGIVIGGFSATGEESNKVTDNEDLETWDVFVPFGGTVTLEWYNQHVVTYICTVYGALEIACEWIGGGDSCYYAEGVFPSGQEVFSVYTPEMFWEHKTEKNSFYKSFNHQVIAKAWEGYLASRLVYIGTPRLEVRELKD